MAHGKTGVAWSHRTAAAGAHQGGHTHPVPPETVILSSGPLSIDPETQRSVGVIVENNRTDPITATIRLFDKTFCPKEILDEFVETVDPGCIVAIAIDDPSFFYEVQVELPGLLDILVTVYALTECFRPIAANTLHHTQLIVLANSDDDPPTESPGTHVTRQQTGAWKSRKKG